MHKNVEGAVDSNVSRHFYLPGHRVAVMSVFVMKADPYVTFKEGL